ncbi:MAG: hypothetical protein R3200_03270 [Xanthomonadales bacterium]|nr:hypothetical protein [Xanthomonadales bacterium]
MSQQACELCGRCVPDLTKHHLIPRTRHSNRRNKRRFSRDEVRNRIAWLCPPCHANLHEQFSNKELEQELNTIDALRNHPVIRRFTRWIARRPPGTRVPIRSWKGD